MYIKQAFKNKHDWWLYLAGLALIVIAVILGQIPHTVALISKALQSGVELGGLDPNKMMQLLESNLNLFLMLLSFAVGLLGLFIVVKFLHKQSITSLTTSRSKIDWKRFWFAFLFWGFISVIMIMIDYQSSTENYVFNFELKPFLILVAIAVIFVPLQTSFEEYLFRGYLMQGIGVICKNKWVPLTVTSVLFGMLHLANPEIDKLGYILLVHYIGTGFFLGIITLMDEGLELALGFHAANNLFTALLVTADWTAFQTNSIFRDISDPDIGAFEIFSSVLIIYPILIFIFAKVYKWKNWKSRLIGPVTKEA
ncbi:MAG: CPBP family intramembrane metalloprotease [Formosa sp.]|jgi:membrane protease YdiL (CAAX protease family)|nr:CPBP family intramembrane metalloprotease [Formosa sp.]MDA9646530.1 CPBP family intramembrane metalloprotease [Flavobacteriaceae bacterium]MDC0382387.1 CPBP family intramembrane metalloprotease [Flavobacteriaceae bacterium]MDC3350767.1 CPBP family intramembrane metalloprotease [Flavobacteriaceae bacterium]|tara:strand:- start:10842 stop:11771 length:930 start_codon:yes stop_codon:yes gene_type:complete